MTLLSVDNLSVQLDRTTVLADISLKLSPGEVVTLIGANGCGKTTLLRAVLGLIPVNGNILWNTRLLRDHKPKDLARIAAYMPQSPTAAGDDRVIDVLRLGRYIFQSTLGLELASDERIIRDTADRLELSDLLNRSLSTLSGGQRQRVFLGRCLVQQPQALLLDEPATFLDLKHQVELYQLLGNLANQTGLAVLMASHDLNLAATHADRAIILKSGRVLADGAIKDVMTEEIISSAFDLKMKRLQNGEAFHLFPAE